jgi:hypothetical protein
MRSARALLALASLTLASHALGQQPFDWTPAREESVIEVLTADADGDLRETPVWIVVVEGAGFVRTNESKWLANIRRGSPVRLRVRNVESAMVASEVADAALRARVEAAFKDKYGMMQRVMSWFRMREPVVLRLDPRTS